MPRSKKKPRAGQGAKASVLTRYIKPKQHLPNGDKQHRSEVLLVEFLEDKKGKQIYSFRYIEDQSEGLLLKASVRYVRVTEEGDPERFFDDIGEGEDGKVKWRDSEARRILYKAVQNGDIPLEASQMELKDIYAFRPEFAAYD